MKNDKADQVVAEPPVALAPNTPAPDFTLQATPDQRVSLRDFRGRPAVLAFYPADWSQVCGGTGYTD